MEQKRCISSLTLEQLAAELKALGQPGFRAKQIFHWVHQKLVTEFSAMTDQPKTLLATLEEHFYIAAPQIERRQEAKDGTVKYLLRMADGNCIETVVTSAFPPAVWCRRSTSWPRKSCSSPFPSRSMRPTTRSAAA